MLCVIYYMLLYVIGNVTDKDLETVVQSLLSSGSITSWKFLARKLEISEGLFYFEIIQMILVAILF